MTRRYQVVSFPRPLAVALSAGMISLFTPPSAHAASMAFMSINGQRSKNIEGSTAQRGREGTIGVFSVNQSVVSPRDPQSGLPTGQPSYKALVITKEVDKASPLLYNVLSTNENLTEVVIRFWGPGLSATARLGTEVQFETVKLTNANISSIETKMLNVRDAVLQKQAMFEEVAFTYQTIEWTWTAGSITATDDWQPRN